MSALPGFVPSMLPLLIGNVTLVTGAFSVNRLFGGLVLSVGFTPREGPPGSYV